MIDLPTCIITKGRDARFNCAPRLLFIKILTAAVFKILINIRVWFLSIVVHLCKNNHTNSPSFTDRCSGQNETAIRATPNKEVKKNTLRKRLFLRGMLICVRVYSFCLVNSKFYQQITIAFHSPLRYGKRSIVQTVIHDICIFQ